MSKAQRILGVARLSRDTDESTSIERQTEHLNGHATRRGGTLVHIAADIDVSGAVSPFERPGLGPWLTDDKAGEYDVICAVKLDRIARSLLGFAALVEWAQARKIDIVTIDDTVNLSGQRVGPWPACSRSSLSSREREQIRARVVDSVRHAMAEGRWHGGTVPDGYRPVKTEDGWRLFQDSERAELLHNIRRHVVGGGSVNSICMQLNADGVLSPEDHARQRAGKAMQGTRWRSSSLIKLLRSRTLVGETVRNGEVIRARTGSRACGPTRSSRSPSSTNYRRRWTNSRRLRGARGRCRRCPVSCSASAASPCTASKPDQRKRQDRYRCKTSANKALTPWCGTPSILAADLMEHIEQVIENVVGDEPVMRRTFVKGEDHTAELEQVERALVELSEDRAAGLYMGERGTREYRAMYVSLEAKRSELEALPQRPDQWIEEPTGMTFDILFDTAETYDERRELLLATGLRFVVGTGEPRVTWTRKPLGPAA